MSAKKIQKNKAFVLLFAVTIAAILLSIALGVVNIAYREIKFGTSAKDTNEAFFAADTGVECALLYDRSDSAQNAFTGDAGSSMSCAGSDIDLNGSAPTWNFVVPGLGESGNGCANVTVTKTPTANDGEYDTEVVSKGYNLNISDPVTGDPCTSSNNSNLVERELVTNYSSYASSSGGGGGGGGGDTDCVGSWSEITPPDCSVTCGGGFLKEVYTITTQQSGNGADCPFADGTVRTGTTTPCNTQACTIPVNGVCGTDPATCTTGTVNNDNNLTSCGTTRTWDCNGSGGGTSALGCSYNNPACATYTLSVVKTGTGRGVITSNPNGINCGTGQTDCSENYNSGTTVILTATWDNSVSTFLGWSGGVCSGAQSTCEISMTQAKSVTASFQRVGR